MPGMIKAKKFDIADTNIALLGSDLEKNVRLNAAQTETAWKAAGKAIGMEIWRIEQFKVVAWPKERYDQFYSGDSYIVLRTYKKTPDDQKLSYDVHFWLGKETSQDEAGTAAYKTVELDDALAGVPVQHREVQGHESALFLSYFPKLTIQEGGVETGFKHVKPEEYRNRLLHVKNSGGRMVVREVPMSHKSLNSGDVFVLDAGKVIHQWNGQQSSGVERHKTGELCRALDDERKGLATVVVHTEGDGDLTEFWALLGGQGPVMSAAEADKQAALEPQSPAKKVLRLSDATGTIQFTEVATGGPIKKSHFQSDDVFVFDAGHEVFVWCGRNASANEKRLGLQFAQTYLANCKRPMWLPISRVLEGGENESFTASLDD